MLKISIPAPCHEDWNRMTPDKTGRHCSSCAKSVVDFTRMSDEEVKYFFLNKKEDERVCGRFKQTQLHQIVIELPQNIYSIEMPLWKKFLAACLVVFSTTLFSCETKIKDKVITNIKTQDLKPSQINEHVMVGGIGFSITHDSIETIEVCSETVGITAIKIIKDTTINELQGDVEILAVNSVNQKQIDTVFTTRPSHEIILTGDTIFTEHPIKNIKLNLTDTSTKTKNPPKADSIDCNTIKNYY